MTVSGLRPQSQTGATPEERLLARDREKFLAAIVESADDAIFAKTLDGVLLSWNAGAQRMYGYTLADVLGQNVRMLAPVERHAEIDDILRRLRSGHAIEHFETERVRRNGERFPVSLAISPVRDASGTIIGASTVARDITERRRLAELETLQKSLLVAQSEASPDGILVIDPDGRVAYANRRFAQIWSVSEDTPAEDLDETLIQAATRRVADGGGFRRRIEEIHGSPTDVGYDTIRTVDGRLLDRYTAPVLGPDNRSFGRVWYFRDVTDETIRIAQLRAIIAAVKDAAIVFDAGGNSVLKNPSARRLLPSVERFDDLRPELAADVSRNGMTQASLPAVGAFVPEAERMLETADGPRHLLVSAVPIALDAAGLRVGPNDPESSAEALPVGTLVLLRDVTELRDAELSREAFIGVLSHELRTPITTIFGAGKMLQRTQEPELRGELLRDMIAESDRLYRLVEDLLVLTRIERESLDIANGPIRITPIVERVAAAERAGSPSAAVEVTIARPLPIVLGEETYVEQVVRNLVGNAIKYGPPNGVVTVRVEPSDGGGVLIRVLDDGPGIAGDEVDRVFELLYRSPATAAQASGSGIGLFVSRRLAQAMGGNLSARARAERGSEFVLELAPYDEAADAR